VAGIGERKTHAGFWWRSAKERDHSEELGVDEIILGVFRK
jgi:hypothetical protein